MNEEALRRAKVDGMRCTQVCVYPFLDTWILTQKLVGDVGAGCGTFAAFPAWFQLHAIAWIRHAEGQGSHRVAPRAQARGPREKHGAGDRGRRQAIQRRHGGRTRRDGPPRARWDEETRDVHLVE